MLLGRRCLGVTLFTKHQNLLGVMVWKFPPSDSFAATMRSKGFRYSAVGR